MPDPSAKVMSLGSRRDYVAWELEGKLEQGSLYLGTDNILEYNRLRTKANEGSTSIMPFWAGDHNAVSQMEDASFGAVMMLDPTWVLSEQRDREAWIREIVRLLVPNGYALVAYQPKSAELMARLLEMAGKHIATHLGTADCIELDELDEMFLACGFQREDVFGTNALTQLMPSRFWSRIRKQGETAFEDIFAIISTISDDPHAVNSSSEALAIYRMTS